jgi:hypothetical protein
MLFFNMPQLHVMLPPVLAGCSEVFAMVGSLELFYSQAPDAMRSTCSALQLIATALGERQAFLIKEASPNTGHPFHSLLSSSPLMHAAGAVLPPCCRQLPGFLAGDYCARHQQRLLGARQRQRCGASAMLTHTLKQTVSYCTRYQHTQRDPLPHILQSNRYLLFPQMGTWITSSS